MSALRRWRPVQLGIPADRYMYVGRKALPHSDLLDVTVRTDTKLVSDSRPWPVSRPSGGVRGGTTRPVLCQECGRIILKCVCRPGRDY